MKTPTLKDCKDTYQEIFYIEDSTIIDLILAVAIGSMTATDPIWLMIIGGSSSGKSEFINSLSTLKKPDGKNLAFDISTLTENTFL